ncbi:unnamed protein product [Cuscuta campestris]|uniref:Nucleoporin Nup188 N-terminal domain-containing protein n=1 Tax=Cuscuta campestris TaxID=132261 RepID=A0A484KR64_9ASTE|nr:unnamed protein product [Cuscuta campestris]
MTETPNTKDQASAVEASLWWDSFSTLLTELENVPFSSDITSSLERKLKDNHAWLLDTNSLFKSPNQKSRDALDGSVLKIDSRQIKIRPELKETALQISSILFLDEVQSYIIVERSLSQNTLARDAPIHELPHLIILHYYVERQCLLKCTRQILMHALCFGTKHNNNHGIVDEAHKLISDGLETKMVHALEDNLSLNFRESMEIDFYTLWAEEILTEDNLILDILFLTFYEFSTCTGKQWRKLCLIYQGFILGSYNFGRLAISTESSSSICHAKVQLLLILIETLNLETLLQMVHDEIPFREGYAAFSLNDVQEIDNVVSDLNAFEKKETGPLILAWAVFLCLVSSLPDKEENIALKEFDHVGYACQAFEAASLSYFLQILQSDIQKYSDGPIAGFRSILRTFVSAFIASYEINLQLEDNNLQLILEIICKIYQGEESLCIQFWDKDSFVDGPIRCLLCNLEGEFPFRTTELLRLLSALSEGSWPSECVFNFLNKSTGLSTLFEISHDTFVDAASQSVKTSHPLHVSGVEGLIIPRGTHGHVLKMVDKNIGLVRWEYTQSGLLVLLLQLAQGTHMENPDKVYAVLDLLSRMVSFNVAVCYALMEFGRSLSNEVCPPNLHMEGYLCFSVAEIICSLIKNLPANSTGANLMSMGVNILTKMLKCSPYRVTTMAVKTNIFDVAFKTNPFEVGTNGLSSGSWLLSGRLAKMLMIDCDQNDCQLTLSVLGFTAELVQTGAENDVVLALVVFSLQYVLVNHEFWKYKARHARWKVSLKALEVIKNSIKSISHGQRHGEVIRDILLFDSSIHSVLFRLVCTTAEGLEKLYVNRLFELVEIEGLQHSMVFTLDILSGLLSFLAKDLPSHQVLLQAVMSPATKPVPVVTAVISLMSFSRNSKIQVAAAKLLSVLFLAGDDSNSCAFGNACFGLDEMQIRNFKNAICSILCKETGADDDLIVATFKMLTSAATNQTSFLSAVIALGDNESSQVCDTDKDQSCQDQLWSQDANILNNISLYVKRSSELMERNPIVLYNLLNFLKALWQGAGHYRNILMQLKNSEFWKQVSNSLMQIKESEDLLEVDPCIAAYRYKCQSSVLDLMAHEMFLLIKSLDAGFHVKQTSPWLQASAEKTVGSSLDKVENSILDILKPWFTSPSLGKLIKLFVAVKYDDHSNLHGKVAASLFVVHLMAKVRGGDTGSLSVSLIDKISILSQKLCKLPAFSELMAYYGDRGYSGGEELQNLIVNDLFYHIQGELDGREISHRPYKELSQYLQGSKFLQTYRCEGRDGFFPQDNDTLFDIDHLEADMGIDMWNFSGWESSKAIAEGLLVWLRKINSMTLVARSKLLAIKPLIILLSMFDDKSIKFGPTNGGKIPEQSMLSGINCTCEYLQATVDMLASISDASNDIFDILASQIQLLFHFVRSMNGRLSLPTSVLILKTSGHGLKVLSSRPSVTSFTTTKKELFMLILFSVKSCCNALNCSSPIEPDNESGKALAEAANVCLGLLPILCKYAGVADYCTICLTTIDVVVKGFSTPATWVPIIKNHLQVQLVVHKLVDKNFCADVHIILKFVLTIACVREGAEMIMSVGFFAYLRELLADFPDGGPFSVVQNEGVLSGTFKDNEKPQSIWGLSLAVATTIIHSLGESSVNVVDYVMAYLIVEKANTIFNYLRAPDFSSDDPEKKQTLAIKTHTPLYALRETENILALICVLARYQNSWIKVMNEMESELRERCIHLLAFISRGTLHHGELSSNSASFLCHPSLRDEFEWKKMPSFINSRNGWFALSSLDCELSREISSRTMTSIIAKGQSNGAVTLDSQTHFSDTVAVQVYRITFLILKFLCIQAKGAAERAQDIGYVDLAHFPELPMPDILHGLQKQGISIVAELCEGNTLKRVSPEEQGVCVLLVQITVMALYLEFCVIQICGMRPVLGHMEDFSKEINLLIRAAEGHAFLKEHIKSLKQIVFFVYPKLLQGEDFMQ